MIHIYLHYDCKTNIELTLEYKKEQEDE